MQVFGPTKLIFTVSLGSFTILLRAGAGGPALRKNVANKWLNEKAWL